MALRDLSDPAAVTAALDEYDRRGQRSFLGHYGFGPARRYFVRRDNELYPSKAIAAAAHGFQFGRPLANSELYGGLSSAVPKLRELGFEIVESDGGVNDQRPALELGRAYSWEELGQRFRFQPDYLGAAGGMVSRPEQNALLLMTHPGGARSIDYGDYWDGDDLVYTGRGKYGDQERTGQNRDVGDNRRELYVFEPAGSRMLSYLGSPTTVEEWQATAPDANGEQRRVLRFRLRFDTPALGTGPVREPLDNPGPAGHQREFDPSHPPSIATAISLTADPAASTALSEKAKQDHHHLVVALHARLLMRGWTDVSEIPTAIDLWGCDPSGARYIFEAKTIRPGRELVRVRSALAQLLEYRFLYGADTDGLCLVSDAPIGDRHARVLSSLDISVIVIEEGRLFPGSEITTGLLGQLLDARETAAD